MNKLLIIGIVIGVISCDNRSVNSKKLLTINDTTIISVPFVEAQTKINFDSIFPVYELSPNTTAFIVEYDPDYKEQITTLDTILKKVYPNDELYNIPNIPAGTTVYDTSGPFQLLKNNLFQQSAKQAYSKEYYVYGTAGFVKTGITDVVISIDECRTNFFAFCFDNNQLKEIGHPLFCTVAPVNINYNNDYQPISAKIEQELSKIPADYDDSVKTTVFANSGKFYFSYNDDFKWNKKVGWALKFPARGVYLLEHDSLQNKWANSLDLFGIPCD